MSQWIDVKDDMPEPMIGVVCYCNDIVSSWQVILRWDVSNGFWCDYCGDEFKCIVTHWQPTQPNP